MGWNSMQDTVEEVRWELGMGMRGGKCSFSFFLSWALLRGFLFFDCFFYGDLFWI